MMHRNAKRLILPVLALALVVPSFLFGYGRAEKTGGTAIAQSASSSPTDTQAMAEATKNLSVIQYSFREVVRTILPVVVEVDVQEQSQASPSTNPFDFFNQAPGQRTGRPAADPGRPGVRHHREEIGGHLLRPHEQPRR